MLPSRDRWNIPGVVSLDRFLVLAHELRATTEPNYRAPRCFARTCGQRLGPEVCHVFLLMPWIGGRLSCEARCFRDASWRCSSLGLDYVSRTTPRSHSGSTRVALGLAKSTKLITSEIFLSYTCWLEVLHETSMHADVP